MPRDHSRSVQICSKVHVKMLEGSSSKERDWQEFIMRHYQVKIGNFSNSHKIGNSTSAILMPIKNFFNAGNIKAGDNPQAINVTK
ncbi:CLUMA_CG001477, isoform A [Clunio marinus]|uniref:CLUMA_CG001477, isoform A n=1 Tax=Clunio marinus TaxID=568069 RepID=A0A1J1HMK2_9DIPT|nr:CLUMA_CG001477, isoform A [Clunio marinus]